MTDTIFINGKFATLDRANPTAVKRILKLDRLRLRGLSGAQDEFVLEATAQNLWRMAKKLVPMLSKGEAIAT